MVSAGSSHLDQPFVHPPFQHTKPALILGGEPATDGMGQILLSVRSCGTAGHKSCYLCAPGLTLEESQRMRCDQKG